MGVLVIDYNQMMLANIHIGLSKFTDVNIDMIRHLFFNNLIALKKKFRDYDEVIIATDSGNTWRKQLFPYYKFKRHQSRAESPLDWEFIFNCIGTLKEELKEFFPYRVISIPTAEADDIIALVVKYYNDNEFIQNGLEVTPKDVMIISSDADFVQLQVYDHVKQYAAIRKTFVRDNKPAEFLIDHIIKAGDDGIPNMLSDDDCFAMDKRQTVMSKKRLELCREYIRTGNFPDEETERRYNRNRVLIDLVNDNIPHNIVDEFNIQMKEQAGKGRTQIMNYFIKNRLKNLMTDVNWV